MIQLTSEQAIRLRKLLATLCSYACECNDENPTHEGRDTFYIPETNSRNWFDNLVWANAVCRYCHTRLLYEEIFGEPFKPLHWDDMEEEFNVSND